MEEKKPSTARAFGIGGSCIFIYLASYYLRNLLSYFKPAMTQSGVMSSEEFGLISSAYMLSYAAGQLFNGILGDFLHPRFMVLFGMFLSGTAMVLFPLTDSLVLHILIYILLGLGLSCLRGPLVRVISENLAPTQARIACMFLSFASFLGPFLTALMAILFVWKTAFFVSAIFCFAIGAFGFLILTYFGKRGWIRLVKKDAARRVTFKSMFGAFRIPGFLAIFSISIIVEVGTTTISYWIPSYIEEGLLFPSAEAKILSAVITLIKATAPLLSLLFFGLCREKIKHCFFFTFSAAFVLFSMQLVVGLPPVLLIVLFLLGLMCMSLAAGLIWDVYLPGLGKTGKVSSANGLLDAGGYVVASVANLLFTELFSAFSWRGMILGWMGFMILGTLLAVFVKFSDDVK